MAGCIGGDGSRAAVAREDPSLPTLSWSSGRDRHWNAKERGDPEEVRERGGSEPEGTAGGGSLDQRVAPRGAPGDTSFRQMNLRPPLHTAPASTK